MLKGIMPNLVSPMHEDGSPDRDGYIRLLDYLFEAPLPGLWVLGSAAEAFNMSHEHRVEVTQIVTEYMDGRTCLLVGAGAGSTVLPQIYRFFEETAHLPITGYHVMPLDRKLNTRAIIDYYTDLAERSPLPLWLYSNPARTLQFPIESVKVLSQHPNIAGMKVGGYDMKLASQLARLNSEKFQVLGAGGSNLLGYLAYGIQCVTMSSGCRYPQEYIKVCELWDQGRINEAREQAFRLNRVSSGFPPLKNSENSAEEKAILEILGICKRWVYPPFKPCDDVAVAQIRRALVENGLL